MGPVLEDLPAAEQPQQRILRIAADPRRQRQPVRPVDGRDGIELNRAEPPYRRLDFARQRTPEPRREALRVDDQPPDLREAGSQRV
jgi:hypothetical protein